MTKAPLMQRRHFEFIAEILEAHKLIVPAGYRDFVRLCEDFATALAQTNRQFNRRRFLEACGIKEST